MCAAARESDKGPGEAGNEAGGEASAAPAGKSPAPLLQAGDTPTHASLLYFERNNKTELLGKVKWERFPASPPAFCFPGKPEFAGIFSHLRAHSVLLYALGL